MQLTKIVGQLTDDKEIGQHLIILSYGNGVELEGRIACNVNVSIL